MSNRLFIPKVLFFTIIGATLIGYQQLEANEESSGRLAFGYSDSLELFDVATKKIETLYTLTPPRFSFTKLSRLNESRFLFDTWAEQKIFEYNLNTRQATFVTHGYAPVVVQEHGKYLFMRSSRETGPQMFIADLDGDQKTVHQIAADFGNNLHDAYPVQVSANEVVFSSTISGTLRPFIYNIQTNSIAQLPIKHSCMPQLWRSKTKQLLCLDSNRKKNYFVGLDGQKEIEAGIKYGSEVPVIYSEKTDAVVISRYRSFSLSEITDVWSFECGTQKRTKLIEKKLIGLGAAVWF